VSLSAQAPLHQYHRAHFGYPPPVPFKQRPLLPPNQILPPTQNARPLSSKRGRPSSLLVTPTPKKARAAAAVPTSSSSTPSTLLALYSRKSKSLSVLAEAFCCFYAQVLPGTDVVIDVVAAELGVERRRIYDVVNILEAIRLVQKKGKNTYTWMGTSHLPRMFALLQQEAIWHFSDDATRNGLLSEQTAERIAEMKLHVPGMDNKSLTRLSQHFIKIFLVGNEIVSLSEASDKIYGSTTTEEFTAMATEGETQPNDGMLHDSKNVQQNTAVQGAKTKVRRLYDIANVFQSLGILSKTTGKGPKSESRVSTRPRYKWSFHMTPSDLLKLYKDIPESVKRERNPFDDVKALKSLAKANSTRQSAVAAAKDVSKSVKSPEDAGHISSNRRDTTSSKVRDIELNKSSAEFEEAEATTPLALSATLSGECTASMGSDAVFTKVTEETPPNINRRGGDNPPSVQQSDSHDTSTHTKSFANIHQTGGALAYSSNCELETELREDGDDDDFLHDDVSCVISRSNAGEPRRVSLSTEPVHSPRQSR